MNRNLLPSKVASVLLIVLTAAGTGATAEGDSVLPIPRVEVEGMSPVDLLETGGSLFYSDPASGHVMRRSGESAEPVGARLVRPWGLARGEGGSPCVSHYTREDPLTRLSAVSCLRDGSWSRVIEGVGQGINGIAFQGEGMWLAAWRATEVESRDGLLAFVEEGEVKRSIELPSQVPQFIAVHPEGGLIVSTWLEDASGYTGGRLLRIDADGSVSELDWSVELPGGIAISEEVTWLADFAVGVLVAVDESGREVDRLKGLAGPLGVVAAESGRVCFAEAGASRIACDE